LICKLDLAFCNLKGNIGGRGNIIARGLIPTEIKAGVTVPVLDNDGVPTVGRKGKPVVAAEYTGLHAFRHFFASWCINRKADGGLELPPKVVQERLGHSSVGMTIDIYGHLSPRGGGGTELRQRRRICRPCEATWARHGTRFPTISKDGHR
jgi:integrase